MQPDLVARSTVAYPELVSWGVSKSHKFRGLVKIGACKGVIKVDLNKSCRGGVPGQPEKPLDTPLLHTDVDGWVDGFVEPVLPCNQKHIHILFMVYYRHR